MLKKHFIRNNISFFVILSIVNLLILSPLSVNAYNGGLTHGLGFKRGSLSTDLEKGGTDLFFGFSNGNLYDNYTLYSINSPSYSYINKYWVKLNSPVSIDSYVIKINSIEKDQLYLEFYDSNKNKLGEFNKLNYSYQKTYLPYIVNNVVYVVIANYSTTQDVSVSEFDVFEAVDHNSPNEVNLQTNVMDTTISLTFTPPTDADFAGTKIYLNGVLKATLDKTKTSYSFTDLTPNTTYSIKVTTFDESGNESDGVTTTVKTKIPIVNNVTDLQADAKYDRVKLSWTPPESEFFHHVKIYRKKIEKQSFWDQLFGSTAVSAATTSDGYTPMFETNGTDWTDLTVTLDTTYSYKVTSVNIEGDESQGVTVETTTPSEPVPVLAGVATTQNENGDYVVTWTSPAKGTVKLLIEGREYAQVDAATKQIVVRKEDMKTDFFGAYAATLIPIGEYGTKGQAVSVPSLGEKIDFPLSFQDFMETVVSILAWVAPFIVLSLVFIFWRPIFNFIKKAISERRVKQ